MKRAIVDKDLCIGCGVCAEVCPRVFEMRNDDKAQAKTISVAPEDEISCRDAADQCPTSAITIEES